MAAPLVLSLPLEEAAARLEAAGYSWEAKVLLPPRNSEADFSGKVVRKYVVRQDLLSDNKFVLTIVYR